MIADRPEELGGLREALAQRSAAESRFRFDATILKRARPEDVAAVEKILERRHSLVGEQVRILAQVTDALARRLQVSPPEEADRVRFLEDFLAAEYRRQYRKLG